jgi:hypothetical protein
MGTRITGGEPEQPKKNYVKYPRSLEVDCLNRAHAEIVVFRIPRGLAEASCPKCGRKTSRA